jgi:3-isopropylmalate dehydrogenase
MSSFNIVVFAGDHCGPEVMAEGIKVLKAIEQHRPDLKFNFQDHLMGGCSIDKLGTPITDEALDAAKAADAILLGAIGGPARHPSPKNGSNINRNGAPAPCARSRAS